MIKKDKKQRRLKIKKSVRAKVFGTAERPRLSVYRSLNHIYAQLIDDMQGITILQVSSLTPELKDNLKNVSSIEKSVKVGEELAKRALGKNISRVVFDRNGYKYHGRVKALAESARKTGLQF